MNKIILGCIADDFTGGGDAASFLEMAGMDTMLFNGIPSDKLSHVPQAAVIALKTRSVSKEEAVEQTRKAAEWLLNQGAKQIYLKYCSTFDSTKEGNIGPVADALMDRLQLPYTLLCPSLPVNGRTVKDGKLFVNGIPLDQSPMKEHPLNPMWDSRIAELMKPQSNYPVYTIKNTNSFDIKDYKHDEHFYLVPDFYNDEQADEIVKKFGSLPLLTGGSGLLKALGKMYVCKYGQKKVEKKVEKGSEKVIILAGSCSKMTLDQIKNYQETGGIAFQISPEKLIKDSHKLMEDVKKFLEENTNENVLIYSSANPEERKSKPGLHIEEKIEKFMSDIAEYATEHGRNHLIVAGGETSGAIAKRLNYSVYHIGEIVSPGVPVMIPENGINRKVVYKSGNFGTVDFFTKAIRIMEEKDET